ncbi:hypothetical protein OIO90_002698 [Microbotryomycetes sp. JL221]|nr:hypothetical protein OIO90_002698 [Microbotryomycetes sp. JL221]
MLGRTSQTCLSRVISRQRRAHTAVKAQLEDEREYFETIRDRHFPLSSSSSSSTGAAQPPSVDTTLATRQLTGALSDNDVEQHHEGHNGNDRAAFWNWDQVRTTDSHLFKQSRPVQQSSFDSSTDKQAASTSSSSATTTTTLTPLSSQTSGPPSDNKIDNVLSRAPTTELELYRLVVRLARSLSPLMSPEYLAWLHSRPQFSHLTSNRTYSVILSKLFKSSSNLRIVDQVLEQMRLKQMFETKDGFQDRVARVLLHGAMRRGHRDSVTTILDTMMDKGWGGVNVFNWRRNLGSTQKGKGDKNALQWHRKSSSDNAADDAGRVDLRQQTRRGGNKFKRKNDLIGDPESNLFEEEPMPTSTRLRLSSPFIPADLDTLTKEDVTMLVEALVQRTRSSDAFQLADAWLTCRREALATFESQRQEQCPAELNMSPQRYNATAIILLNILIKGLVKSGTNHSTIELRSFIEQFVERHSLSQYDIAHCHPLKPRRSTLNTLLMSIKYRRHAWKRALNNINWFYETFGVPTNEAGGSQPLSQAIKFKSQVLGVNVEELQPIDVVNGQTALILLKLAMTNWLSFVPRIIRPMSTSTAQNESPSQRLAHQVRTWWNRIDKQAGPDDADLSVWSTRQSKVVECDAILIGLLECPEDRKQELKSVMNTRRREFQLQDQTRRERRGAIEGQKNQRQRSRKR